MADTPVTPQNDPAQQFLVGGQPASGEQVEFLGQKFNSMDEAQAQVAAYIRQTEAQLAELRGAATVRPVQQPAAPVTPQQRQTFDNDAHFRQLANNPPDAYKQWLRYEMFGDPNAQADPVQVLRETALSTIQLRNQLQMLTLKNDHPEINWNDPKQTELIQQLAPQHGPEGAIAILQNQGKLPRREQYEAWKAQQMQAYVGQVVAPQQQAASLWQSNAQTNPGVIQMPVQPPPAVPRGGAAQQPQYDMNAIRSRLDELASVPVAQQTPQLNQEFDKLWGIWNAQQQQKVG